MDQPSPPDDLYFVHPIVDFLCVGGASLFLFLYFRLSLTGFAKTQVSDFTLSAIGALMWVGNWPHFSATNWRLYENPAHVRQFRLTAILIPVLVSLGTAACFCFPISFAPYFVKLFILWSPYHFSAQTMGLTLIYARRAGLPVSALARDALTVFFISSFLVMFAESEMSLRTGYLSAIAYPQLALPSWTPLVFTLVMYGALAVLAWELLPELPKLPRLPWIFFCPILTQYLWFIHSAKDLTFQLYIPFFHALQYLLVAWSMEMQNPLRRKGTFLGRSAKWFALNAIFGAFLFTGIPHLLALGGWNLDFSMLILSCGIALHHYFVDGVIWKLRQEGSGSPLFRNVRWAWRRVA